MSDDDERIQDEHDVEVLWNESDSALRLRFMDMQGNFACHDFTHEDTVMLFEFMKDKLGDNNQSVVDKIFNTFNKGDKDD
jgi:hypothetical protein